jgi:hypothetical protein
MYSIIKQTVALVVFLILSTTFVKAQSVQGGARIGVNASWIGKAPENSNADGVNYGFNGGVWVRVAFREADESSLFLQGELLYSRFGSKTTSILQTGLSTLETKSARIFTAFDLPILLGYKINISESFEFRLYGGPVFSKILTAEDKFTRTVIFDNTRAAVSDANDIKNDVKNYSTSAMFGVGLNLGRVTLDLRYQRVMSNMYVNSSNNDSKPAMLQLGIGCRIF